MGMEASEVASVVAGAVLEVDSVAVDAVSEVVSEAASVLVFILVLQSTTPLVEEVLFILIRTR